MATPTSNNQPTVPDTDAQGNETAANNPNTADAPEEPAAEQPKAGGITIGFKDPHGGEVSFKLKATTKLKKAMDAYAQRVDRNVLTLRSLFDGERVLEGSTAEGVSFLSFPFLGRGSGCVC